jgi:hypothetical protein
VLLNWILRAFPGDDGTMNAELRIIPGCPNGPESRELFATALELEGYDAGSLTVRSVDSDEQAQALGFHGSPSFVVDGRDLFPSDAAPAVACRVYPTQLGLRGAPSLETLRRALADARPGESKAHAAAPGDG